MEYDEKCGYFWDYLKDACLSCWITTLSMPCLCRWDCSRRKDEWKKVLKSLEKAPECVGLVTNEQ